MISTVTVNYKTADYIEKMLESLFKFHPKDEVEVFVVENGSGQDLSHLEKRFPSVKFIYSKKNLGFAGGCNLAIEKAKGDFVALINPDIIFTSSALFQIEKQMKNEPDIGVGGVSLKNLDGTQQACVWHFPTPVDQFLVLLKIHHLFPNIGPIKHWLLKDFNYSKSSDVDQVMGAFFCIRKEVIEQIGMLDDGFFLWYEEVDFCKRTKDAGWRVHYFADISARHKLGSSFERVTTLKKQNVLRKSIRRYMKKHYGTGIWLRFLIMEPIFYLFSLAASVIKK